MATFISLTNLVLRRINEVTIDETEFLSAKNIQALAKDAVNIAIREILHDAQEWPFTLETEVQTCTVGTGVYSLPADASNVDWDSFYLKKLTATNNVPTKLEPISYTNYLLSYRPTEELSAESGRTTPYFVYQTQDLKFGLTPIPDQAYEVEYKYWKYPSDLTASSDECIIPDRFKDVIVDGAMMHLMLFRSNEQAFALYQNRFQMGIRMMRRLLQDEPIDITSTYVHRPIYFPRLI
jgi:hypothetical protein